MCLYTNYKTPSIAEVDITCYTDYYEFQVFKCIIPKGTQYYEGHTTFSSSKGINDGFEYIQVPCYCSEALIVKPRKELSSFTLLKRKIRDVFIYLKLMIFK